MVRWGEREVERNTWRIGEKKSSVVDRTWEIMAENGAVASNSVNKSIQNSESESGDLDTTGCGAPVAPTPRPVRSLTGHGFASTR